MASSILHIKDSYYFEVPKSMWRSRRDSVSEFPDWWVRLDPDYQLWEAKQLYDALEGFAPAAELPAWNALQNQYVHWKESDHAHFGKPFASFLEEGADQEWFAHLRENTSFEESWSRAKAETVAVGDYQGQWSPEKIAGYNKSLDGKILIPQLPGATLRNAYEPESGFCISKFMVIELVVAMIIVFVFSWLASKMRDGGAPKGRMWNLLETVIVYLRDEVVRPVIGDDDTNRFLPLLWTIFFFILGCNLFGMIPWLGSPTASIGVTITLALIIFLTVIVSGIRKLGLGGFFKNMMPEIDLGHAIPNVLIALPLAIFILAIELFGLCVKHAVLGIRLVANMVAGHLVLLGLMGMAFSLDVVIELSQTQWSMMAVVVVLGSSLFSCLELFVAFLQAYVFTFLSALFISSAIHHH